MFSSIIKYCYLKYTSYCEDDILIKTSTGPLVSPRAADKFDCGYRKRTLLISCVSVKQILPSCLLNNTWHWGSRWLSPPVSLFYSIACVITEEISDKAAGHVAALNSAEAKFSDLCTGHSSRWIPKWDRHVQHFTSQLDIYDRMCSPNDGLVTCQRAGMVNNPSSYSRHLAEFPLLSIGIGSIPTHLISNTYIFSDLISLTEFVHVGISSIWYIQIVAGQNVDHTTLIILYITNIRRLEMVVLEPHKTLSHSWSQFFHFPFRPSITYQI